MKKLRMLVLCTLLFMALAVSALGAEQRYTWQELEEARASIDWEEAVAAGVMAYGIERNSVGVLIDMSNPAAGDYMEKLTEQLGDRVSFEDGTGMEIVFTPATLEPEGLGTAYMRPGNSQKSWLWPLAAALSVLAIFSFWRAHTTRVYQTADGRNVAASARPTSAQVAAAVRKSNFAPSSGLDRRILAEIDKI